MMHKPVADSVDPSNLNPTTITDTFMAIRKTIDKALETALVVIMGVMVLNVLWQVLSRFLSSQRIIESASSFTDELARYLLIWVGILGAAYASGKGMHLAIDLLPTRLSGQKARNLNLLIQGLVFLFALLAMFVGGIRLVYVTHLLGQSSPALGVPLSYVYAIVPVSGLLIMYYSLMDFLALLGAADVDEVEAP